MQYLIRKKNNIDIEISKFEDDNEPLDVYTISSRGCTCPAAWRRKTCKHTRIVKFWTSNLNSETGAVLGLNENDDPYKISNIFGDNHPAITIERIKEWLDPKKMSYI
jgi:hypothetical protein